MINGSPIAIIILMDDGVNPNGLAILKARPSLQSSKGCLGSWAYAHLSASSLKRAQACAELTFAAQLS